MADSADNKKAKAKPKMMDVARPKKTSTPTDPSQKLVISPRPIMNRNIAVSSPVDEDSNPEEEREQAAPQLASKRPVVAPLSATEADSTPKSQAATETDGEEAEESKSQKATPAEATESDSATPKAGTATTETEEAVAESDDEAEDTTTDDAQAPAKQQPNAETRKAVEEAKQAAKRQEEVEKYIDSKQFFVPINAIAHKRSIKVSALLTVLVFLLALILIDLMIDSGIILLIQKIPHTHFFTS